MHSIQQGLVHRICGDRCGNCGLPRTTHVDEKCLFDATMFRQETVKEHLNADCDCEMIVEETVSPRAPTVTPRE